MASGFEPGCSSRNPQPGRAALAGGDWALAQAGRSTDSAGDKGALLLAARAAREALSLDRVLFVPAGDPWRKADREERWLDGAD